MKHPHVRCAGCDAVYLKAPWHDDGAGYGEGSASCELCGAVIDRWEGCEPYYWLLQTDKNSPRSPQIEVTEAPISATEAHDE
jgi:hypothetical protein